MSVEAINALVASNAALGDGVGSASYGFKNVEATIIAPTPDGQTPTSSYNMFGIIKGFCDSAASSMSVAAGAATNASNDLVNLNIGSGNVSDGLLINATKLGDAATSFLKISAICFLYQARLTLLGQGNTPLEPAMGSTLYMEIGYVFTGGFGDLKPDDSEYTANQISARNAIMSYNPPVVPIRGGSRSICATAGAAASAAAVVGVSLVTAIKANNVVAANQAFTDHLVQVAKDAQKTADQALIDAANLAATTAAGDLTKYKTDANEAVTTAKKNADDALAAAVKQQKITDDAQEGLDISTAKHAQQTLDSQAATTTSKGALLAGTLDSTPDGGTSDGNILGMPAWLFYTIIASIIAAIIAYLLI